MHLNASENMVGKLLSSHLNATALRGDNGWAEIKLRTFPSPKDYSDAILRMVVAHSAGTRSTPQIIQRIYQGAKCSPPYKPDIKPNARDTEVGFQRTIQMLKWLNGTACNCKLPSFLSTKGLFINDVIILSRYPRFSLQTTHVLRVYNVPSIHRWSEVRPAENDDAMSRNSP